SQEAFGAVDVAARIAAEPDPAMEEQADVHRDEACRESDDRPPEQGAPPDRPTPRRGVPLAAGSGRDPSQRAAGPSAGAVRRLTAPTRPRPSMSVTPRRLLGDVPRR